MTSRRQPAAGSASTKFHRALEAVLVGERIVADLRAARGGVAFRPEFVRAMRRERRGAR